MADDQTKQTHRLPDGLAKICAGLTHSRDERRWRDACRAVMSEYGDLVFNHIRNEPQAATLVGIFATFAHDSQRDPSYEDLTELLSKKPAEVLDYLSYIGKRAWADGPGADQDAIGAAGYAARSLISELGELTLKERRAVIKAAALAAVAHMKTLHVDD